MRPKYFILLSFFLYSCFEISISSKQSICDDLVNHYYNNNKNIIFIPQVFTPNGDMINDQLFATGVNIKTLKIKIYLKKKVIFQTINNTQKYPVIWDGYYRGNTAIYSDNLYNYDINCIFNDGENITLKGNFVLLTKCNNIFDKNPNCYLTSDVFRFDKFESYSSDPILNCITQ